jgi:hypothetical protein
MDVDALLSPSERQGLLLSVGTHRGKRPLSPLEVATIFEKIVGAGGSLADCARAARLDGTTMVGRFLRLLSLPEAVRHLVDWGSRPGTVGPSAGAELARLNDDDAEEQVVRGVLTYRLSSAEVRQVVQLRKRSRRPIADCLNEVVGMRSTVDRRYVYVGAVTDGDLAGALRTMSQNDRDALLARALDTALPGQELSVSRLAPTRFTLVGGAEFGALLGQKQDALEGLINDALSGAAR